MRRSGDLTSRGVGSGGCGPGNGSFGGEGRGKGPGGCGLGGTGGSGVGMLAMEEQRIQLTDGSVHLAVGPSHVSSAIRTRETRGHLVKAWMPAAP